MEHPRQLIVLWAVTVAAWNPVARAQETAQPRPTPRPGTLASVAAQRPLVRTDGADSPIVINDENLVRLADGAVVTMLKAPTAGDDRPVAAAETVDPTTREKWRKRVAAQQRAVAKAEARRAAIERELGCLHRNRLDSKTLDRIAAAESKLRAAEVEIRQARTELGRIIRAARLEGAQPGWFR